MILDEIVEHKRREVEERRRGVSIDELERRARGKGAARDFLKSLRAKPRPAVIAECKHASPSRGLIRDPYDPVAIATAYEANGAAAISVLTDEKFFRGSLQHLTAVRNAVKLPVLRKDFVIDEYQIFEARAAGADVVLLIAAILEAKRMQDFIDVVRGLGMQALVEVHSIDEIERAALANTGVVGVNNRNLDTLKVDIRRTEHLMYHMPTNTFVVAESGIRTREHFAYMREIGVGGVLIGEHFMYAPDPGRALAELIAP